MVSILSPQPKVTNPPTLRSLTSAIEHLALATKGPTQEDAIVAGQDALAFEATYAPLIQAIERGDEDTATDQLAQLLVAQRSRNDERCVCGVMRYSHDYFGCGEWERAA